MRGRRTPPLKSRWILALLLIAALPAAVAGQYGPSCSIDPRKSTHNVGQDHSVTVTVEQYGDPYQGASVDFRVTSGPNSGIRGTGVTDKKGEATFVYTGSSGTGTDTVEAEGSTYMGKFSCTATVTWQEEQSTKLDLDISWSGYVVQEAAIATAHLTRNGTAVKGVPVQFEIIAGPHKGQKATSATDATGHATFTIRSNGLLGTDRVRAEANTSEHTDPDSEARLFSSAAVWSEEDAGFCEFEWTPEGYRPTHCHTWLEEVIMCLIGGLGRAVPQSAALSPERIDLYRRLRDSVLGNSVRGKQYVNLYYRLSGEALDIVAKNPRLVPRLLEILEEEEPLVRQLVATGSGTLREADRQKIDDLLRDVAPSGSDRFWTAVNELRNDLYDDEALEQFGVTVR